MKLTDKGMCEEYLPGSDVLTYPESHMDWVRRAYGLEARAGWRTYYNCLRRESFIVGCKRFTCDCRVESWYEIER